MHDTPGPIPSAARLARELADGAPDQRFAAELADWLSGSARFRAFAAANALKARKKVRGATDVETLRDVRLELLVARLLLADRRVSLEWERQGSAVGGPDLTLRMPGLRPVDVEVTRLRRSPQEVEPGVPWLAKLRQLPPSVPNVLVIGVDGGSAAALDVAGSVRLVRARADARDGAWLAPRGFASARAFYERFLRLGAVFAWCEGADADERVATWRNGSARIAVPDPLVRSIEAALHGSAGGRRPDP